jgi:mannose/cellobiose epimerase-like protein (N-acyl-D-glucosamine 2-epimerase family)
MHMCEALLAAFKATGDKKYLNRSAFLAETMTQKRCVETNGWIWEHYNENWEIDWKYNIDNPKHVFRPWGFQPGHQIEWSKLCMMLYECLPDQSWLLSTAIRLFDATVAVAWDEANGGLVYSLSRDQSTVCDGDKYYWVQAEGIATAALLASITGEQK